MPALQPMSCPDTSSRNRGSQAPARNSITVCILSTSARNFGLSTAPMPAIPSHSMVLMLAKLSTYLKCMSTPDTPSTVLLNHN